MDAPASAAGDPLVALLQGHEQDLLRRAHSPAAAASPHATAGGAGNAAALPSLHRAHEQLMSIVAARISSRQGVGSGGSGQGGAGGQGAPVDPREVVGKVAADLTGGGVDDTVRGRTCGLASGLHEEVGSSLCTTDVCAWRARAHQVVLLEVVGRGGGGTVYVGACCYARGSLLPAASLIRAGLDARKEFLCLVRLTCGCRAVARLAGGRQDGGV